MSEKKKISYDQAMALDRGARDWNRRQHREKVQREADAKAKAEREAYAAACGVTRFHNWKNWEYSSDYTTESRTCRECGATETREVRL